MSLSVEQIVGVVSPDGTAILRGGGNADISLVGPTVGGARLVIGDPTSEVDLDGATDLTGNIEVSLVDWEGDPTSVTWLIDAVEYRDDDLNVPYTLGYSNAGVPVGQQVTGPSGNLHLLSFSSAHTITARIVYATGPDIDVPATFNTGADPNPDPGGGTGGGGGGNTGTGGGVNGGDTGIWDEADYPFPIKFPTKRRHTGLEALGVPRSSLSTVPGGSIVIRPGDGPHASAGAGTSGNPYVYSRRRFDGQVLCEDGVHVRLEECLVTTNGLYGFRSRGGSHGTALWCDFDPLGGTPPQGMIAFFSSLLVEGCTILGAGDGIKWSNAGASGGLSIARDTWIRNQVEGDKHVDSTQTDSLQEPHILVQRCNMISQSVKSSGATHYGNSNFQMKVSDAKAFDVEWEDSYLQAGNYGLNLRGNNKASRAVARRLIMDPSTDGTRSNWTAGTAIRTNTSSQSSGPNNTTYTIEQIYRTGGAVLWA